MTLSKNHSHSSSTFENSFPFFQSFLHPSFTHFHPSPILSHSLPPPSLVGYVLALLKTSGMWATYLWIAICWPRSSPFLICFPYFSSLFCLYQINKFQLNFFLFTTPNKIHLSNFCSDFNINNQHIFGLLAITVVNDDNISQN